MSDTIYLVFTGKTFYKGAWASWILSKRAYTLTNKSMSFVSNKQLDAELIPSMACNLFIDFFCKDVIIQDSNLCKSVEHVNSKTFSHMSQSHNCSFITPKYLIKDTAETTILASIPFTGITV